MIHSLSDGGFSQVVVLGAGLDTRPWRLRLTNDAVDANDIAYFELDFPEMFSFKLAKLKEAGVANTMFRYSPLCVDLSLQWQEELLRHENGFNSNAKTIFLLEGLTGYLTEAENLKLFEAITSIACPGSRLLATFLTSQTTVKTDMHRFQPTDPLHFVVSNFPCWSGISVSLQDSLFEYGRIGVCEGFTGYCLVDVQRE